MGSHRGEMQWGAPINSPSVHISPGRKEEFGSVPYRFNRMILLRHGLESIKVVIHFPFDTRIRIDRQHPFVARTSQSSDSAQ